MTSPATEQPAVAISRRHYRLAVLALAIGGFAIGTTEFVTMGVLPEIADGVHVSVPTAGHVISAYAVGVVVGVPIFSFFAAGLPRKAMLLGLMGVYALFNVLSAAATSFGLLFAARFFDGLPHGAYFGTASIVAASLADPKHRGRAVAMVMFGLSVANVVGVPASTWLGEHAGWRVPYLVSALLALVTVAMCARYVPHIAADPEATGRREAAEFFTSSQVWLTMLAGSIGFGGLFAIYSYIAKIVTDVAHLSEGLAPLYVLAFGLGMVAGTPLAGELARWSVFKSLLLSGVVSIVVMLVVWLVAPNGWLLWPAIFLVTMTGSVLTINLQVRLMDVAGNAVTLGAAMNHAALNIANALGAYLGGLAIDASGYRAPALVGAALAVIGTAILLVSALVHVRTRPTPTFPSEERC